MSAYAGERVKRGLWHFMLGKGVSSVAGFAAMVLVVRGLTIDEFAAYSVLVALVEVFTAVSGLGLSHVVLRYVPELFNRARLVVLSKLMRVVLVLRTSVLVVALAAAALVSDRLAGWLGLENHLAALQLFLLVVGLRTTSHFLSQVMDSTLHQGISQIAFSSAAVLRCAGMAWLIQTGHPSLLDVIALEATCDALACVILLFGLARLLAVKNGAATEPTDDWLKANTKQLSRFAMTAYLQHLATLPFGGNTNRLVGGVLFGERMMAGFGFALSLYDYVKRYLPTQLLVGVIRPVIVARYTADGNFQRVAMLCEKSFQVNLSLLLIITTPLIVAGTEILSTISAGKYGQDSAWILLALMALLALETRRVLLEVQAQTVERYDLMIRSNLLLSSSVLLGIAAYPWLGAIAFPLGNAAVLLVANRAVAGKLAALGYVQAPGWRSTARALHIFLAALAAGWLARSLGAHWLVATVVSMTVHLGLFMFLQLQGVRDYVKDLLGAR